MKSAFECLQHAAKCEQMARDTYDKADRTLLLATASQWRTLGEAAKVAEALPPRVDKNST